MGAKPRPAPASTGAAAGPVLHVIGDGVRRGAQNYVNDVLPWLRRHGDHRVTTLFEHPDGVIAGADSLGLGSGRLRRAGLDPRAVLGLRHHVRCLEPSAVVAHGSEPTKYAALALGRGIPLVQYRIGVRTERSDRWISRAVASLVARRVDAVVGVSAACIADDQFTGRIARRRQVIPNGRDPAAWPVADRDVAGPVRLLFVGQLMASKRPGWVVEAVRRLTSRGIEVEATIVGEGPLLDEIRHQCEGLAIDVLGARGDVADLMARHDVMVFTSDRFEGLPGVLIEAAMTGLATVSTDAPGAREVIEDGVTGRIVGIDDLDAFVDAVAKLVAEPTTRRVWGAAAAERSRSNLTLESSAALWHELLSDL